MSAWYWKAATPSDSRAGTVSVGDRFSCSILPGSEVAHELEESGFEIGHGGHADE